MRMQIVEHTIVNGSVHTGCTQHERVCAQICLQTCLRILCEWGFSVSKAFYRAAVELCKAAQLCMLILGMWYLSLGLLRPVSGVRYAVYELVTLLCQQHLFWRNPPDKTRNCWVLQANVRDYSTELPAILEKNIIGCAGLRLWTPPYLSQRGRTNWGVQAFDEGNVRSGRVSAHASRLQFGVWNEVGHISHWLSLFISASPTRHFWAVMKKQEQCRATKTFSSCSAKVTRNIKLYVCVCVDMQNQCVLHEIPMQMSFTSMVPKETMSYVKCWRCLVRVWCPRHLVWRTWPQPPGKQSLDTMSPPVENGEHNHPLNHAKYAP